MLVVDLIAGAVIAGAVLWGFRQGFVGALPLAGFAAGAVLGTRVPLLAGEELRSSSALLIALPAALVLGALLAAAAERLGSRLGRRRRARGRDGGVRAVVSSTGGAVLAGSLAVVAVWIVGSAATEVKSLREPVDDSSVLARLNSVLVPPGPVPAEGQLPIEQLPRFATAPPDVPAADPRLETDPDVRRVVRSVVKIGVVGCGRGGLGAGWFAAPGIVVTNAHVVAEGRAFRVRLRGTGPRLEAIPIWFDRRNDLALLRVPKLTHVPHLPMVRQPRSGTSGASVGFPAGIRRIRRARLGPTSRKLEGRITGPRNGFRSQLYGRLLTSFRGRVRPGNSGGPVVDGRGRVLTTAANASTAGGLGVPNRFVRSALRQAGPIVGTGDCSRGVF